MLIAEELLLLALDPTRGREMNGSRSTLGVCLAGALVAELGIDGLVTLDGRRFTTSGARPADPLLRASYDVLAAGGGRRSADQLRRVDKTLRTRNAIVDRLADAGIVGRQAPSGFWRVTRHPVLDAAAYANVLSRAQAAVAGDGPLEARTAVLVALAGPARLLEVVAGGTAHAHVKRRIAEATSLTSVAPVVKRVIAEAQAATIASVAAVTAATTASG